MTMSASVVASFKSAFKRAIKKIGYKEKKYCDIITPLNTYRNIEYNTLRVTLDTLRFSYVYGTTVTVCNKTAIINMLDKKG